jgi:catechol 2,3-dioxygenase-like lactoylglutathione lyase family enzyme
LAWYAKRKVACVAEFGWRGVCYRGGMPKSRTRPNVALDHVSLPVRRLAAARKFYVAALGALGMTVNMDVGEAFGMGSQKEKIFWISRKRGSTGGAHHAFRVASRGDVNAFHRAGLAAGGTDHGAPGPRPNYGPHYYAAFLKDPEGNNIEVVCYRKPSKSRAAR